MLKQVSGYHVNEKYANQTRYWSGSDNFVRWQHNMQDQVRRKQLEKYQFDQIESISYSFNRHGFRCKEFDDSEGFITLGCSFTEGVGLPQDQVWPAIVEKSTNLSAWNLGVGGCSTDTCFRLLCNWIEKLNVKFVLLLTPDISRFEFFLDSQPTSFLPHNIEHNVQKYWYSQNSNSELNAVKNYLAMKELCREHNIKFVTATLDVITGGFGLPFPLPIARDFMHVGHANHVACANYFLNKLN